MIYTNNGVRRTRHESNGIKKKHCKYSGSNEYRHPLDVATFLHELGLCLGCYGQGRSSILQQPARGRVTTAAKPVAASRLWCAVPVKQRNLFYWNGHN